MLTCKVYDESGKEILSKPISHFSERIRRDSEIGLSCIFRVLAENAATEIDAYRDIVDTPIGKVAIFSEETLIVEYTKYKIVNEVQIDYGEIEFSGVVTFAI